MGYEAVFIASYMHAHLLTTLLAMKQVIVGLLPTKQFNYTAWSLLALKFAYQLSNCSKQLLKFIKIVLIKAIKIDSFPELLVTEGRNVYIVTYL